MGFFKKVVSAVKKVVSGVKKVFAKITKPFAKIMQNKLFKGVMLAAAIVTGGIAIYGGIMGAMGAAGTQAWSTLSMTSKFVTGAKAFVAGAQAAVGSAIGSVKGALGFEGATGGAGIGASATAAGQGSAQAAFAAANPELAKLGLGHTNGAIGHLGETGIASGGLGQSAQVGNVSASGSTAAVDAQSGVSGIADQAKSIINTAPSTGTSTAAQVTDTVAKATMDATNAQNPDAGLLSQASSMLGGGGWGAALATMGGNALSGMANAKSAEEMQDKQLQAEKDNEADNWYNNITAGELNAGNWKAPQGLLTSMSGQAQEYYDRARQGQINFQNPNYV